LLGDPIGHIDNIAVGCKERFASWDKSSIGSFHSSEGGGPFFNESAGNIVNIGDFGRYFLIRVSKYDPLLQGDKS
jgi:hypothetical protein